MKDHTGGGRGGLVGAGLALALGLSLATPAMAGERHWDDGSWQDPRDGWSWEDKGPPEAKPAAQGLVAPLLGLAVDDRQRVYVSQSFAGILSKVGRDGSTIDVATEPGFAVTGVDVGRRGTVTYLVTRTDPTAPLAGLVKRINGKGQVKTLADVAKYEVDVNPDQFQSYGFQGLSAECAAQVPAAVGGGDPYPGLIDSNAYAVAVLPNGGVVVADAGGNDLVHVSRRGEVRTLAVLPPRPVTVTDDIRQALGLPECTVGFVFNLEPVPTDVEVGPDGMLYVSSLPGGPEDGSLGARGAVFRVNPWNGRVKEVATGFAGAVDLAVDDDGTIYVAEMFGGRITKVGHHGTWTVADVDAPGAVEYVKGKLYVTVGNGFPSFGQPVASVVRIKVD